VKRAYSVVTSFWKHSPFALTLLLLSGVTAFGEIITTDRRINWQGNVGVSGGIPNVTTVYTTLNPSGGDDTAAINNALTACPANQVVKLNSGTFNVNGLIDYQSIGSGKVLRGNGRPTPPSR